MSGQKPKRKAPFPSKETRSITLCLLNPVKTATLSPASGVLRRIVRNCSRARIGGTPQSISTSVNYIYAHRFTCRSHVRSDFKAFICLSETCPGPVRTFPRFSEWHEHMISVHGETWYQEVYPPMAWVCPICRHGRSEFIEPQDLHDHLGLDHGLTELQREAVVHQSRIPTKRPPNICFLCCLPVDDDDWHVLDGRKREHTSPTSHRRAKRARVDIGDSTTPLRYQQDDPTQSPPERPGDEISNQNSEPTKRMSEHIARHLESLMLMAIRLMSIGRVDEGQLGEQADHPSDSVATATTSRYSSLEY